MDIKKLYLQTLEGLENHQRPKHDFTDEQFLFLFQTLGKSLEEKKLGIGRKYLLLIRSRQAAP